MLGGMRYVYDGPRLEMTFLGHTKDRKHFAIPEPPDAALWYIDLYGATCLFTRGYERLECCQIGCKFALGRTLH